MSRSDARQVVPLHRIARSGPHATEGEEMNDSEVLRQLHNDLSADLDRIGERFDGHPKLTLIVRNPQFADADVVLTNEDVVDLGLVVAAIRLFQERAPEDLPEDL
jgi:hypothetical protein